MATRKIIVFRKISGDTNTALDWYDHYTKQGLQRFPASNHKCFSQSGNYLTGLMFDPKDIEFLREQAFEKAKKEAGLVTAKINLRDYRIVVLPQEVDWGHWDKEIKNSRRNIKQVMDALSQYNLGGFKLPDSSTLKVSDYMMTVRDAMVEAYPNMYLKEFEEPTDRMREDAAKLVEEHEAEKKAASEERKQTNAKKKSTGKKTSTKKDEEVTLIVDGQAEDVTITIKEDSQETQGEDNAEA
jgi:hypothetical protein